MCMNCFLVTTLLPVGASSCSKSSEKGRCKVKPGLNNGDVCINPKNDAEMVWVPEGEFLMGSNDIETAKPQREVYLDGYWMTNLVKGLTTGVVTPIV